MILQELLRLDDVSFSALFVPSSPSRRREWIVFGGSVVLGFLLNPMFRTFSPSSWQTLYLWVFHLTMVGLLGWRIYLGITHSVIVNRLQQHSPHIDLLDLKPCEALGRYSLTSALMIIGGVTLAVILMPARFLLNAYTLLLTGLLVIVAVVVFFWTLRGTHRIMREAKEHRLGLIRGHLAVALAELLESDAEQAPRELAARLDAIGVWLSSFCWGTPCGVMSGVFWQNDVGV